MSKNTLTITAHAKNVLYKFVVRDLKDPNLPEHWREQLLDMERIRYLQKVIPFESDDDLVQVLARWDILEKAWQIEWENHDIPPFLARYY